MLVARSDVVEYGSLPVAPWITRLESLATLRALAARLFRAGVSERSEDGTERSYVSLETVAQILDLSPGMVQVLASLLAGLVRDPGSVRYRGAPGTEAESVETRPLVLYLVVLLFLRDARRADTADVWPWQREQLAKAAAATSGPTGPGGATPSAALGSAPPPAALSTAVPPAALAGAIAAGATGLSVRGGGASSPSPPSVSPPPGPSGGGPLASSPPGSLSLGSLGSASPEEGLSSPAHATLAAARRAERDAGVAAAAGHGCGTTAKGAGAALRQLLADHVALQEGLLTGLAAFLSRHALELLDLAAVAETGAGLGGAGAGDVSDPADPERVTGAASRARDLDRLDILLDVLPDPGTESGAGPAGSAPTPSTAATVPSIVAEGGDEGGFPSRGTSPSPPESEADDMEVDGASAYGGRRGNREDDSNDDDENDDDEDDDGSEDPLALPGAQSAPPSAACPLFPARGGEAAGGGADAGATAAPAPTVGELAAWLSEVLAPSAEGVYAAAGGLGAAVATDVASASSSALSQAPSGTFSQSLSGTLFGSPSLGGSGGNGGGPPYGSPSLGIAQPSPPGGAATPSLTPIRIPGTFSSGSAGGASSTAASSIPFAPASPMAGSYGAAAATGGSPSPFSPASPRGTGASGGSGGAASPAPGSAAPSPQLPSSPTLGAPTSPFASGSSPPGTPGRASPAPLGSPRGAAHSEPLGIQLRRVHTHAQEGSGGSRSPLGPHGGSGGGGAATRGFLALSPLGAAGPASPAAGAGLCAPLASPPAAGGSSPASAPSADVRGATKGTVLLSEEDLSSGRLRLLGCSDTAVYALGPLSRALVAGCSDCTVVLGAAADVRLERCARVTLVAAAARLVASSCHDCSLHVAVNARPILLGDCRFVQLAPHSAGYERLVAHARAAGVLPGLSQWDRPLAVVAERKGSDGAAKHGDHPAGAAGAPPPGSGASEASLGPASPATPSVDPFRDVVDALDAREASAIAGGPPAATLLPPDKLAPFAIPFRGGRGRLCGGPPRRSGGGPAATAAPAAAAAGAGAGAAAPRVGGRDGLTGFLSQGDWAPSAPESPWPLPEPYARSWARRVQAAGSVRAAVRAAQLDEEQKRELMAAIQWAFREWLQSSSNLRQVYDLARVERDAGGGGAT